MTPGARIFLHCNVLYNNMGKHWGGAKQKVEVYGSGKTLV